MQKWLDLIRGQLLSTTVDNLKMGAERPPIPFSDANLLGSLFYIPFGSYQMWQAVMQCEFIGSIAKYVLPRLSNYCGGR